MKDLVINLDELQNMCVNCSFAVEHINNANALLKKIPQHKDWMCSEKKNIEESLADLSSESALLLEKIELFSSDIHSTRERFNTVLESTDKEFANIFELLSQICSLNPQSAVHSGDNVASVVSNTNNSTMNQGLSIWQFEDVDSLVRSE